MHGVQGRALGDGVLHGEVGARRLVALVRPAGARRPGGVAQRGVRAQPRAVRVAVRRQHRQPCRHGQGGGSNPSEQAKHSGGRARRSRLLPEVPPPSQMRRRMEHAEADDAVAVGSTPRMWLLSSRWCEPAWLGLEPPPMPIQGLGGGVLVGLGGTGNAIISHALGKQRKTKRNKICEVCHLVGRRSRWLCSRDGGRADVVEVVVEVAGVASTEGMLLPVDNSEWCE